jgi:hypothetical protein
MGNLLTLDNFMQEVVSGQYDNHLDKLSNVVKTRKGLLRAQEEAALKVSLNDEDRVRFKNSTKPKYLRGHEGTVVGDVKTKKVFVKIDPAPMFVKGTYFGKTLNCPLSILEKI